DEARIRSDWKFIHFAPQYRFFYEGQCCVAWRVWKMENLPAAWHQLRNDLQLDADLPELNKLSPEWFEPMSEALVGRINMLYARDFALFGYAKRPGRVRGAVSTAGTANCGRSCVTWTSPTPAKSEPAQANAIAPRTSPTMPSPN